VEGNSTQVQRGEHAVCVHGTVTNRLVNGVAAELSAGI
jgi:hypothetical protein